MGTMRILMDHSAKLYQFIDDFASAGGNCQRPKGIFRQWAAEILSVSTPFALRYGKICDSSHLISISQANPANRETMVMTMNDKTRTELEAAAFRRLVEHLRAR